jgi:hypothetical protein
MGLPLAEISIGLVLLLATGALVAAVRQPRYLNLQARPLSHDDVATPMPVARIVTGIILLSELTLVVGVLAALTGYPDDPGAKSYLPKIGLLVAGFLGGGWTLHRVTWGRANQA